MLLGYISVDLMRIVLCGCFFAAFCRGFRSFFASQSSFLGLLALWIVVFSVSFALQYQSASCLPRCDLSVGSDGAPQMAVVGTWRQFGTAEQDK